MSYVELHAHSAFSFLDGTSQPEELVAAALERGYEALALTDHDTISGSMEFAQAASSLGLKAIHGTELSVRADGAVPAPEIGRTGWQPPPVRHLTLLVRDARGWRNLCRLLTIAHAHTREAPGRRRDLVPPSVTLEQLADHATGLVCLSGCARQGVRDEPTLRRLRSIFGSEGLRVELQRPFARHDRARNRELAALAQRLGLACVATGDVHAHTRERAQLQDAFVAIRAHTTLDASEPLRRGNHGHVLSTPAAMAARFADHPEAVAETARLAAELDFDLTQDLGYRYPGAEDTTADATLAALCSGLFEGRYPLGHRLRERAAARLAEELQLIRRLGLSGFFLLHHDLLELAREVALEVRGAGTARSLLPPGRGRGSSVSSIVCYLTGLSHVDPVENELFLGRFLNEEITALPDIDLDFPRDIREVLIPRVHDRYGRDRAALVAAFPTYRARGAIRELGKALGLPPGEIERVARASEGFGAFKVGEDITYALGDERLQASDPPTRWEWLVRLAEEAHGLPRHLSQHSGGMIVATRPLIDCCAVVPAAMEGRQMVMWDKDSCSDAGFLKIDVLGLGMLSAAERCVELIARRRDERIDLSRIPYDDPATYEAIQKAETTGVFQIESRAQMASLLRTRPETLDDLTIQVAIVRPGPIQGGAVNPYIERRQRVREQPGYEVPYEHESLRGPLADTLGTIIFQDQVIEVAMAFAGFSPGEAEGLRRAMSRKRSEAAIRAYHERFVAGALRTHGVERAVAERIYEMIVGFSGFGFPKAHGAAFGLLAYQSTWLRVHYAPEFLAALLDEQPMGFYPPDALVHEAQRRGLTILPPDVNASQVGCTVEDLPEALVALGAGEPGGSEAVAPDPADGPVPVRPIAPVAGRLAAPDAAAPDAAAPDAAAPVVVAPVAPVVTPAAPAVAASAAAGDAPGQRGRRVGHLTVVPTTADGGLSTPADVDPPAPADRRTAAPVLPGRRVGPPLDDVSRRSGIRIGLGYILGVRSDEVAAVVAAREQGGPFTSVEELTARSGAGRPALERLAWSGACDGLVAAEVPVPGHRRRAALWRLGVAAPGVRLRRMRTSTGPQDLGTQLALPLEVPAAPALPQLSAWDGMIADYQSTGVATAHHPVGLLREELDLQRAVSSLGLARVRHGSTVRVGGLVVARQRPGTAKGIVFMLLEDEGGTINLIVPPDIYDRDRLAVRTEPLVLAEGRLERHPAAGGQVNVLVRRIWALEAPDRPLAEVRDFSPLDLAELERQQLAAEPAVAAAGGGAAGGAAAGGDFRAVAPPVMSFAQGRRR